MLPRRMLAGILDVDLVGAGILLVILAGGYFTALEPSRRALLAEGGRAEELRAREADLANLAATRANVRRQSQSLSDAIVAHRESIPDRSAFPAILAQLSELCGQHGITLHRIAPDPPRRAARWTTIDVKLSGAGKLVDLLAFAARMRESNGYHGLHDVVVKSSPDAGATLEWSMRFHLLENGDELWAGLQP